MPLQDYCPYCSELITIPDGVSELTCPHCQTLLEFDVPQDEQAQEPQPAPAPETQKKRRAARKTSASKKIKLGRSGRSGRYKSTGTQNEDDSETSTNTARSSRSGKYKSTHTSNGTVRDSSRRIRLNTKQDARQTRTPEDPPPQQEVLLGKTKTGRISKRTTSPPETVLNFVDEDGKKRPQSPPPNVPTGTAPAPVLNFIDEDSKRTSTSTRIPAVTEAIPAPLDSDTSNIKFATPVGIDNVTGLLATQSNPAPQKAPEPKQTTPGAVKIVGSSTEFKIEKDSPRTTMPKGSGVDTKEKTRLDMDSLLGDNPPNAVDEARRAAEQELQRAAQQAKLEAEQARKELEEAKRQAEEERRRLEAMRLHAEREEAQWQQEELRRERDELQRQQEEMRQLAEEAKQQAEALKAQRAQEEARRAQEEEARRAQEEEARRAQEEEARNAAAMEEAIKRAKEVAKEEAIKRAKENALAKAKERLIEEKKRTLVEEAKRKVQSAPVGGTQSGRPAPPKAQSKKISKGKGVDLTRKKKKKRPLNIKGGRTQPRTRDERGETSGDSE